MTYNAVIPGYGESGTLTLTSIQAETLKEAEWKAIQIVNRYAGFELLTQLPDGTKIEPTKSKTILQVVHKCLGCPFCHIPLIGEEWMHERPVCNYECRSMTMDEARIIPDWCPLQDYNGENKIDREIC